MRTPDETQPEITSYDIAHTRTYVHGWATSHVWHANKEHICSNGGKGSPTINFLCAGDAQAVKVDYTNTHYTFHERSVVGDCDHV
jgi:hypothetical protein